MHYHTAHSSHPGGREQQEDSVAVFATPDAGCALLAVADGMGGHRGGELASQAVVETVAKAWGTAQAGVADPKLFLAELCQQANQAILKLAQDTGLNPHSTCVFLWLDGPRAWWAHVGGFAAGLGMTAAMDKLGLLAPPPSPAEQRYTPRYEDRGW